MSPAPGFRRRQAVIGGLGRIPPGGPSPFGATLAASYPRLPESTGSIHDVSTRSALESAVANDASGTIVRLTSSIVGSGSSDIIYLTRNASLSNPITVTSVPGVVISNFMQFNIRGSGLRFRGLEIEGGSDCGIKIDTVGHDMEVDGCDIYDHARQGILWAQTVYNIQVWNTFLHNNGSWVNQNLDHGMYTSYSRGPCVIANCVSYFNSAYSLQMYPDCPGLVVVCCTFDDGQIHDPWSRGGVVIGSNTGLTDDTITVGCLSTYAPSWGWSAYDPGAGDTNNVIYDSLGYGNGAGDFGTGGGLSYVNCAHADPGYFNRGARDYRIGTSSPAVGKVQASRYGWVPPRDILGNLRVTADAGAFAKQ